ncbi:MAG: hypothetical protein JXB38_20805 [Anaerolineales bacterium]|nr:hypothetical protein [Anaerolineales bacterium]
MNGSVETLLVVHIGVVALFLAAVAWLLWRRGLFRWDRAGFWAWFSFLLYFAINPFFALQGGDLSVYRINLELSGGTERGLWILFVLLAGMAAFFTAYLRAHPRVITWRLRGNRVTLPMLAGGAVFALFGIYSLLTRRAQVVDTGQELVVEGGRFVGQVTGYENAGYLFLVVPLAVLLLSRSRWAQLLGWLLSGLLVFLALPSGWSRFVLVSILIMVALANTLKRRAAWPRWYFLPLLLVFSLALQLRGHVQWTLAGSGGALVDLSRQVVQDLGASISNAAASSEVSALATWYLGSYATEHYYGYSYGLPVVNYALTGWIPSRFFPHKYFLVDWLASQRLYLGNSATRLLYGAKSTLLGSFYNEGWLVGVILLAALAGVLSRKLDGMLHPNAPVLVRATGIAMMSVLWMVWQSSDTWGVMTLGTLAMPALVLWLFAPKVRRRRLANRVPVGVTQ